MNLRSTLAILLLLNCVTVGFCSVLAVKGYVASSPPVRNLLIKSGLGTLVKRKSEKLYEASNFRSVFDQGTDVRKAAMDAHDIVEIHTNQQNQDVKMDRSGLIPPENRHIRDGDRMYSERLFSVLTEMDKKSCVYRLMCEIGADPKAFGIVGLKIHRYLKSVPPVTWNSATYAYKEAFQAGLGSGTGLCSQHYSSCPYNLNRVMKFLGILFNPLKL